MDFTSPRAGKEVIQGQKSWYPSKAGERSLQSDLGEGEGAHSVDPSFFLSSSLIFKIQEKAREVMGIYTCLLEGKQYVYHGR